MYNLSLSTGSAVLSSVVGAGIDTILRCLVYTASSMSAKDIIKTIGYIVCNSYNNFFSSSGINTQNEYI